jgi:hypothetical protein
VGPKRIGSHISFAKYRKITALDGCLKIKETYLTEHKSRQG